ARDHAPCGQGVQARRHRVHDQLDRLRVHARHRLDHAHVGAVGELPLERAAQEGVVPLDVAGEHPEAEEHRAAVVVDLALVLGAPRPRGLEHLPEHRSHELVEAGEVAVERSPADTGALRERVDGDLAVIGGEVPGGGEDRRLGPGGTWVRSTLVPGHSRMIALGVRPWPGASGERRLRWATAAQEDDRTGQPHWTTVRHDGGMARPSPPASFPKLLAQLPGQTIVHTRVAARGTWTVTTRGWVLHSRIQDLPGGPVGLRDPRAVGAAFEQVRLEEDELVVALRPTGETSQRSGTSPRGGEILSLRLRPAWEVTGPRRARAGITARGERWEEPPGP